MDFVARAGAMIDRAHRIAGLLLICVVVLGALTTCQWTKNVSLNRQLMERRVSLPVIVVPEATVGLYSPTTDDRLVEMFTGLMTQSINTFTPETLVKQYEFAKGFFSPVLLTDSATYFERKIRDSLADRRSSLFVPDKLSTKVKKYEQNGIQVREVNLTGRISTIISGVVAEDVPVEISMKFQKVDVSPANPYGFVLSYYREMQLVKPGEMPTLAPAGQNGQTPPVSAQ